MATLFTADTHFGDHAARALSKRPFATVPAMDAALIEAWNAAVAPEDVVYHLGDFAVHHPAPGDVLAQLHGEKHLITGNNDSPAVRALAWASVQPYLEITVDEVPLVLCHYALRSWAGMGKRVWNLHGHSHGRLKPLPHQADVGVDVWAFRPVTIGAIKECRRRGLAPPGTGGAADG